MKIKSILLPLVVIAIVAFVSYYIGGSMRGRNPDQQPVPTPNIETEHLSPPLKIANGATNQEKITVSNTSAVSAKQIETIESEFGRKKQEIEAYYADKFRQLQQNVETTLKEYDATDKAAYASFTEELNHTVSTTSGSVSLTGNVSSPSGYVSAQGYYDETTHTQVAGAPSVDYGRHVQRMNKAVNNLMDEYELDFEHLQRRRACALSDLEKEKSQATVAIRSQETSQSASPTSTITQGVVTGIIYSEENPLGVIDGKVIREGQVIREVKVIKINQDSVEFEYAGTRWRQKVNESPSNNWP